MIFNFVVRKLRWLARVPLFPQIFDTVLLLWTFLCDRQVLGQFEALEDRARDLLGVTLGLHRFGGIDFVFDQRELAHLHGNGLFDAFVGSEARVELVRAGMATPHHLFPESGWVSLWVRTDRDVVNALELMRLARDQQTPAGIGKIESYAF